jgi:hypothetical protein
MDPVKIEEARTRAAVSRERSVERGRLKTAEREREPSRGRLLGMGIENAAGLSLPTSEATNTKGKGKERGKENLPLR